MLKNYFTIAINNLLKNKLYSAINIIGLAIGLAACILISLYVKDELSYDKGWEKADLIYRINNVWIIGPSPKNTFPLTSSQALPALKKYFAEDIEFGTRIRVRRDEIKIGNRNFPGSISFVDKDFVDIFQVEVLKGSLQSTLQNPGNIALSEESAIQYFGERDPIGKLITLIQNDGNKEQYKVTAVYRFISSNTVLSVPSFSLLDESKLGPPNWLAFGLETYIRFKDEAVITKFIDRLPDFINQNIPANNMIQLGPDNKMSDIRSYSPQKMSDIYFNPNNLLSDQVIKTGNMTVITVFIIISILVLIIGCINFVILTTAKATQRAREVAMRKVVGARFRQLLIQFLGESMLLTLIAFFFAVAMIEMALPFFELVVDKQLIIPYSSPGSYVFVILLLAFVGLLGGLYPAFVLSKFAPSRTLKANQTTETDGSIRLRKILVVFQFATSIILIIATAVAYFQLLYAGNHDPGFNPEKLIVVEGVGRQDLSQYRNTLQKELIKLPEVTNVALSSIQPNLVGGIMQALSPLRRKTDESTSTESKYFNNMLVDYNFFKTYEMSLLSGRSFTQELDQDEPGPFSRKASESKNNKRLIINMEAARQFGFASADEAVGKILQSGEPGGPAYKEYTIIGVVKNSQFRNLRMKPEPEVYFLAPDSTFFMTIKYHGDYQTAVEEVKRVWHKVVGDFLFNDSNVVQNLATSFSEEEKENKVLIAFALLSVFIACMGLFGMASFTVDRRVKEIGLRKVMGAKVKDIVRVLGWNFLKPVLIANIIAWPISIFAMQSWLERFPYRFNPLYMIPICLGSGLISLAIAWFTVAGNTTRVAKSNPIKALRYE